MCSSCCKSVWLIWRHVYALSVVLLMVEVLGLRALMVCGVQPFVRLYVL